jgi:ABC-2 type transport system permease protein
MIFVVVTIFVLAGLTFSETGVGQQQGPTNGVVIYGFVLFLFLSDTLWGIGYNIRREQKQGTLEQLYLSPASKFASLISRVAVILIWTGLLSIGSIFLMGGLLGSLPLANPVLGLYLLLMSLAGTFGLGFAFAALTMRVKETGQVLANALQFIFLILTANFFPFSALPEGLRWISRLIPLSYAVDSFRSTLMGFPPGFPELAPIELEIVIVTVFGLLMPWFGYRLYRRAEDRARRTGTLSEY